MTQKAGLFLFFIAFCIVLCISCVGSLKSEKIIKQWHTLTLSFEGPLTSEMDSNNPFLNYLLMVEFTHADTTHMVRGFYAADGNAAETSANSGNVWQVRFTPGQLGLWTYKATLYNGDSIAIQNNYFGGEVVDLTDNEGTIKVTPSDKTGNDFRARGRIIAHNGYFKYSNTDEYFLKIGTDSPENFLAYEDFDGTYRMEVKNRDGEAQTNSAIHSYEPHLGDWVEGEPTWQEGKGKAIIGAVNYLSSKEMNVVYFITLNIGGDGKDVWMYSNPDDFTRFDVSKLEQWEIVFEHMQSMGIMLHVVVQETENETLLDGGEMGPLRTLYYQELIARFGHHLALVWNLGEENGPVPWSPEKPWQTDAQRKAGAKFFKENDPYNHPVVLHTLPDEEMRVGIMDDMLGFRYLDGISLQHAERQSAPEVIAGWKEKSIESGQPWLICMDEIGIWHTGAKTDSADLNHPTLTRYALWGTLLSGAAGIEWYFGAYSAHNDLTSEDWRQRDRLWEISSYAKEFFENYLPYWDMKPYHELVSADSAYCLAKPGEIYALYIPKYRESLLDLSDASGNFKISWYNPFKGGELKNGTVLNITGGRISNLGMPPNRITEDWVILVKRME